MSVMLRLMKPAPAESIDRRSTTLPMTYLIHGRPYSHLDDISRWDGQAGQSEEIGRIGKSKRLLFRRVKVLMLHVLDSHTRKLFQGCPLVRWHTLNLELCEPIHKANEHRQDEHQNRVDDLNRSH